MPVRPTSSTSPTRHAHRLARSRSLPFDPPRTALARSLAYLPSQATLLALAFLVLLLASSGCRAERSRRAEEAMALPAAATDTARSPALARGFATPLAPPTRAMNAVATADLPPDLAVTATAIYSVLRSTPRPQPARTGGGDPSQGALVAPPPASAARMGGAGPAQSPPVGLPPDLALTATPHYHSLRATPVPMVSRTGGADLSPNPVATAPPGMPATGSEAQEAPSTERYAALWDNPFQATIGEPLSTFSIDVDSASYSNVRRYLDGASCRRRMRCVSRS